MKHSIQLFIITFLILIGQGIQHLNANVIMKNRAGETTEITAESPLLAENGEPLVWVTKDNQNNLAVINITCNQSMSGNTFYRNKLGDVFTLHYSAEPELNSWEWRSIGGTILAQNPTQTYTTSGSFTGDMSYAQSSSYGSGVAYTYGVYFVLADPAGGGGTEFDATFMVFNSEPSFELIEGADIAVEGVGSATTGVSGTAVFTDLTNGTYNYTVNASGYDERTGSFLVNGDDVDVEINFTSYSAEFSIVDEDTWGNVENAVISILGVGEISGGLYGFAIYDGLYAGTYSYTITAVGYEDYSGEFTINLNDVNVDSWMTPAPISYYNANFTIIDNNTSLAIENASITIGDVGNETSDVNGQASFIDLAEGSYNYTIVADGYENYSSNFTINAGDEDINVQLTSIGVGINQQAITTVQVTPNPSKYQLFINKNFTTENELFSIYDISGKFVQSFQLNSTITCIDISSFENGMYLYSITNETSKTITGKFVKH